MEGRYDLFRLWESQQNQEGNAAWTHPAFADAARAADLTCTRYMEHAARWRAQQTQHDSQPQSHSQPQPQPQPQLQPQQQQQTHPPRPQPQSQSQQQPRQFPWPQDPPYQHPQQRPQQHPHQKSQQQNPGRPIPYSPRDLNDAYLRGRYEDRSTPASQAPSEQYVKPPDIGPPTSYHRWCQGSISANPPSQSPQQPVATSQPSQTAVRQERNAQSPALSQPQPKHQPMRQFSPPNPRNSTPISVSQERSLTPLQPTHITRITPSSNGLLAQRQKTRQDEPERSRTPSDQSQPRNQPSSIQDRRESYLGTDVYPANSPKGDPYTSAARTTLSPNSSNRPHPSAPKSSSVANQPAPQSTLDTTSASTTKSLVKSASTPAVSSSPIFRPYIPGEKRGSHSSTSSSTAQATAPERRRSTTEVQADSAKIAQSRPSTSALLDTAVVKGPPAETSQPVQPDHSTTKGPRVIDTSPAPSLPSATQEKPQQSQLSSLNRPCSPLRRATPVPQKALLSSRIQGKDRSKPGPQADRTSGPTPVMPTHSSTPMDLDESSPVNTQPVPRAESLSAIPSTQPPAGPSSPLPAPSSAPLSSVSPRQHGHPPKHLNKSPHLRNIINSSHPPPASNGSMGPPAQQIQPPAGPSSGEQLPAPKRQELNDGSQDADGQPKPVKRHRHRYQSWQTQLRQRPELTQPLNPNDAEVKLTYDPTTIARDVLIAAAKHPSEEPLNYHLSTLQKNMWSMDMGADLTTIRWDLIDPIVPRDPSHRPPSRPPVPAPAPAPAPAPMQPINTSRPSTLNPPQALDPRAHIHSFAFKPPSYHTVPQLPPAVSPYWPPSQPAVRYPIPAPRPTPSNPVTPATIQITKPPSSSKPTVIPPATNAKDIPSTAKPKVIPPSPKAKVPSQSPRTRNFAQPQVVIQSPQKMPPIKRRPGRPRLADKVEKMDKVEISIPSSSTEPTQDFPIFPCGWEGCHGELHNLSLLQSHVLKIHVPHNLVCGWKGCDDGTPRAAAAMWEHVRDKHIMTFAWTLGDGPTVPAPGERLDLNASIL
ncbi:uncharacterized protein N7483_011756 [Penicillium malachiteum]|uniref:uncharacterized protein n=1 Tax=Penicillium malachiteum TaxID=1324776 RepID=UPI0025499748|nr:uncharacterized protein N7483_011756 [Penicillium malachiteum]KAJ5714575.1 hypothetical protein N7483_011756 [Penicillium malachiteum]